MAFEARPRLPQAPDRRPLKGQIDKQEGVYILCKTDAPAPKPKSQPEKFRDLARELECDEDEAAFDERLRKLATTPKAPKAPKDDDK